MYGAGIANNVLQFLAMLVTIWLTILNCTEEGSQQDCILAIGDNTLAISRMQKLDEWNPSPLTMLLSK
jgi:hypothetical protein